MSVQRMPRLGGAMVTTFGLGTLRPAPGTWGSLPPVVLVALMLVLGVRPGTAGGEAAWGWGAWLVYHGVLGAVVLAFSLACMAWGNEAEAAFGKKDPGSVCADETAGMCLPLMFLPAGALSGEWAGWTLLLAFLAFRIFDILKLPPAQGLQRHAAGLGILLDDLAAGMQALVLVQLVTRLAMA
jgi:phosphatidylglycerophosphatase A